MKQEEKELLVKDLCARLPYGVKANNEIQGDFKIYGICENFVFGRNEICHIDFDVEKIKPYLFPLSSMTEEQLYELREMFGFEIEFRDELIELSTFHHNRLGYLEMDAMFEWFNRNHFDCRGLIPMGLAIDATNLNIY